MKFDDRSSVDHTIVRCELIQLEGLRLMQSSEDVLTMCTPGKDPFKVKAPMELPQNT